MMLFVAGCWDDKDPNRIETVSDAMSARVTAAGQQRIKRSCYRPQHMQQVSA
jgi:hypothetical protein